MHLPNDEAFKFHSKLSKLRRQFSHQPLKPRKHLLAPEKISAASHRLPNPLSQAPSLPGPTSVDRLIFSSSHRPRYCKVRIKKNQKKLFHTTTHGVTPTKRRIRAPVTVDRHAPYVFHTFSALPTTDTEGRLSASCLFMCHRPSRSFPFPTSRTWSS
jgi:hypothetical protein